jgi:C-terminal processing protease CtpA/Prc
MTVVAEYRQAQLLTPHGWCDCQVDRVVEVMPSTPAYWQGIREGDVLTAVEGEPVMDSRDAVPALQSVRPCAVPGWRGERGGA